MDRNSPDHLKTLQGFQPTMNLFQIKRVLQRASELDSLLWLHGGARTRAGVFLPAKYFDSLMYAYEGMAVAAFGIIRNEDRILLVKIAEPFRDAHKWNFPGGIIEDGEDIETGLAREILEESNIAAKIHFCIDIFDTIEPENTIHIFNGLYLSGDISIQEFELEDGGWFTIEEALNLPLAFNVRDYISKLQ